MDNKKSVLNNEILEITKEDIKNFWLSFFPELKSSEELNDLLKKIANKDLDMFYEERIKNEEKINEEIEAIFKKCENCDFQKTLDLILIEEQNENQWAYFYKPILKKYVGKLFTIIHKSNVIAKEDKFFNDVISHIIKMLINISFRVLVLETNIASMEKKLKGKTKYERSEYFCKTLLNNENYLKELYFQYPELVRIMNKYTENLVEYIYEIISNTEKEYSNICKTINNNKPLGKIDCIEFGKGDTHNNSKSVVKIKFDTGIYLMYKPRKLDIEIQFGNFIDWLNKKIPDFKKLKSCKCYTSHNSGWMEFIEQSPCKTNEDINKFYQRIGQILCILYTLNSRDCHYENIIANGEYPMLIDLETLLHLDLFSYYVDVDNIQNVETYISNIIQRSVIGIGLLPTLFQNNKTDDVMEVGGLGSTKKKISPFKTQILKNFDSDDIHVENIFKEIPLSSNSPKLNNVIVGPEKYINDIRNSFKETYNWILNNKTEYINEIKKEFYDLRTRLLYKNTNIYVQLLETGYHPDLLHNKSDREIYFNRIGLLIDKSQPFTEDRLYQSEIKEMLNCDVPMFFINIKDNLVTNNNGDMFNNIHSETIFDDVKYKINNLSSTDLDRQISFINQSFVGCKIDIDLPSKTNITFKQSLKEINLKELLDTAFKLGDLIIERSISININDKNHSSWIGLKGFGDDFYNICPGGTDLYLGNGGIAIFLAYLSKISNKEKYINATKSSIEPIIKNLKDITCDKCENIDIGAFSGITSYYYSIYMCIKQKIFNEKETNDLIMLLERKLDLIDQIINEEIKLDIIGGLSGVLGVLISIYDIVNNNSKIKILELCNNILGKLKETAININDESITWSKDGNISYAHGNAGIITQLMRLYNITSDESIFTLIKKALNYERQQFNFKKGQWMLKKKTHYFSWCNGIGGLLLSKLLLYKLGYVDDNLLNEISILITQIKQVGFGTNHSICHGDIGSLSILYYAASILKDAELKYDCNKTLNSFNEDFVIKNWFAFQTTEDWGLMTGASGVGLGISSLYDDDIIINMLLLQ